MPRRASSTETVSTFSRGCQSKTTWMPSLAGGELAGLQCGGAHGSFLSFGHQVARLHAPTLRAALGGRRRKAGFEPAPADDSNSHRMSPAPTRSRRRRVRRTIRSTRERNRISYVAREYWFELLIAAMGIASMIELVIWRDYPGAPARSQTSLSAIALLVLRSSRVGGSPSPLRPRTGSWPPPSRLSTAC